MFANNFYNAIINNLIFQTFLFFYIPIIYGVNPQMSPNSDPINPIGTPENPVVLT